MAGGAAVTPAADILVVQNNTSAYVDDGAVVNADRDIIVKAIATEDILTVAVGAAGSGTIAVGGAVVVVSFNNSTLAYIGDSNASDLQGATASAGGNILVAADDTTTITNGVGGVGIGIGTAGIGGSVSVSVINKNTQAYLGDYGTIDAKANNTGLSGVYDGGGSGGTFSTLTNFRGLSVQASSSEKLVNIVVAGGAGNFLGLAGAVTVQDLDSDTIAYIGSNTNVNSSRTGANSEQSVNVAAVNKATFETKTIGFAGGQVGISGSVDVGTVNNSVNAYTSGGSSIFASKDVLVYALSYKQIDSLVISGSVGLGALTGAVSVWSLGGNFTDGGSLSADALRNLTVTIDRSSDLGSSLAGSAPLDRTFEATGANGVVDYNLETIDFGSAQGFVTGDAVVYRKGTGNAIGGLVDGQTYYVIVTDSDRLRLATSEQNALAGTGINLTTAVNTDGVHSLTLKLKTPTIALGADNGVNSFPGVVARLDGQIVAGGDIKVRADEELNLKATTGSGAVGLVGLGGSVVVMTVNSLTDASLGAQAQITTDKQLSVIADFSETFNGFAVGGAAGVVGLGAQVVIFNDTSSQKAHFDAGTTVLKANTISLFATADRFLNAENFGLSAGGLAAGAAISRLNVSGETSAYLGDGDSSRFVTIGTANGTQVGSIDIFANSQTIANAISQGVAVGIGAGSGNDAKVNIAPTITATIGNGAKIWSSSTVSATAFSEVNAIAETKGITVGGVAIGVSLSEAKITSIVKASIGSDAAVTAGNIELKALHNVSENGTLIDRGADAKANASGGGLLAGLGTAPVAISSVTVGTIVGDRAVLQATGDLTLNAKANNKAISTGQGNSGGIIGVGVVESSTSLTTRNSATIGVDVAISVGGNLIILAQTNNNGDADATGATGGVIDISQSKTTISIDEQTTTTIGDRTSITAGNNLTISASNDTKTDNPKVKVDTGGLGVNGKATATATYTNVTTTSIGSNVNLDALLIDILAVVNSLNLGIEAVTTASGLGTEATATATNTTSSTATVNIGSNAKLRGIDSVELAAKQNTLNVTSNASATSNALGGNTVSGANTTLNTNTSVNTGIGSEIRTRDLLVAANVPYLPTYSATAATDGAAIDTGESSGTRTLSLLRTIDFNSKIVILGAPSPTLEVDANGNIVKQINVSVQETPTEIIVGDIANSGDIAGKITFSIPDSLFEVLSSIPAEYGTVTSTSKLTGNPTVEFLNGFDRVDLTNRSNKNLQINDIDTLYGTTPSANIVINVKDSSGFNYTATVTPVATPITITNTGTGDIRLNGVINNSLGTVVINNTGSDIFALDNTVQINTDRLSLNAVGQIGSSTNQIRTQTNLINAIAGGDIYLNEFDSSLTVGEVRSTTGAIIINAFGDIVDNNTATMTASRITLNSQTGGIGSASNDLAIDASGLINALNVAAAKGIYLTDIAGGLSVGDVTATSGDVILTVVDTIASGDDLRLSSISKLRAVQGSLQVRVGDHLTATAGSIISAATTVTIQGDFGNADTGIGTVFDLRGSITATSVLLEGNSDADLITLTNTQVNTTTTVNLGAGDDRLWIGSLATPQNNRNGLLDRALGLLIVSGGAGNDTIELDDSGDTKVNTGTITSTQVTGFGSAGVQYGEIESLQIFLGTAADSATISSSSVNTSLLLDTGAGDDTIAVGNSSNTVNNLAGLLEIRGNTGNDRLTLADNGDSTANTGTLDGNRLTGLGMGGSDKGILYGGIESLAVNLGAGNDTFTVTSTITNTTIDLGLGTDSLTVGTNLTSILSPLRVRGGGGTDSLNVNSTASSDLTLDKLNTLGILTGQGIAGRIEFEQIGTLNVTQGSGDDIFRIKDNIVTLNLNTGAGNDFVAIDTSSFAANINLGTGNDFVTVLDNRTLLTIIGTDDATDRVEVDRSKLRQ